MTRPKGSVNVTPFADRSYVETSSNKKIRHLADLDANPLDQFKHHLKNQENFLQWIDTRHKELRDSKKELAGLKGNNKRGPKDETYSKYRWYAGQLTLLEAINNFELFYKQTLISLASNLKDFIPQATSRVQLMGKCFGL